MSNPQDAKLLVMVVHVYLSTENYMAAYFICIEVCGLWKTNKYFLTVLFCLIVYKL